MAGLFALSASLSAAIREEKIPLRELLGVVQIGVQRLPESSDLETWSTSRLTSVPTFRPCLREDRSRLADLHDLEVLPHRTRGRRARRGRCFRRAWIDLTTTNMNDEPLARAEIDVVSGVGYDRAAALPRRRPLPRAAPGRHQPGRARLRDARSPCACGRSIPGVTVDEVVAATGFDWSCPTTCPRPACRPTRSCASSAR